MNNGKTEGGLLKGRTALITGGTSGIGEAAVILFCRQKANVVFTGRRRDMGEAMALRLKGMGQVHFIEADHTREEDCGRSVNKTLDEFGRIDILFNNAGIVTRGTAEATSDEVWKNTFEVNVVSVWRMCRLVIPYMRRQGGGVIVNNASDWGLVGGKNAVAYCASKGAVVQMTRAMALDHARDGIRVNVVCPGDTYVKRWDEEDYAGREGFSDMEEFLKDAGNTLPMGRVGNAGEVAQAVLYLASDASSFITGVCLPVDGGNTAQ